MEISILYGICERSSAHQCRGNFPEKWRIFTAVETLKVCGVEKESLWRNRWRTRDVPFLEFTVCGESIAQDSTGIFTGEISLVRNGTGISGDFSPQGFSTSC